MSDLFHVTSTRNRESIWEHGLDWTCMRAARGIAGSTCPEVDGIFLCIDQHDVDYFVRMNNTGGSVDVWAVRGVEAEQLVESSNGYLYLPAPVPAECLALLKEGLPPVPRREPSAPSSAYRSNLTITLDDGTVLRDEAAHAWMRGHGGE